MVWNIGDEYSTAPTELIFASSYSDSKSTTRKIDTTDKQPETVSSRRAATSRSGTFHRTWRIHRTGSRPSKSSVIFWCGYSSCIGHMISTGIRQLKNNLSHYVRQIEAGKRIAVTAHGRVVAELVPLRPAHVPGAAGTRSSSPQVSSSPQRSPMHLPGAAGYPPVAWHCFRQGRENGRGPVNTFGTGSAHFARAFWGVDFVPKRRATSLPSFLQIDPEERGQLVEGDEVDAVVEIHVARALHPVRAPWAGQPACRPLR